VDIDNIHRAAALLNQIKLTGFTRKQMLRRLTELEDYVNAAL